MIEGSKKLVDDVAEYVSVDWSKLSDNVPYTTLVSGRRCGDSDV